MAIATPPGAGISFPETIDTRRRMIDRYLETAERLVADATRRVGEPPDEEPDEGAEVEAIAEEDAPEPVSGEAELDAIADARVDLEGWANVPVVTVRDLEGIFAALRAIPIPAPDEHVAEVSTPASLFAVARCQNCQQEIELTITGIEPELTIHADRSGEIKLKGKTKARSHICGQSSFRSGDRTNGHVAIAEGQEELPVADPELDDAPGQVLAMLTLVLPADDVPSLDTIRAWGPAVVEQVGDWAAAEHLYASDHTDVVRLPLPGVLGGEADPEPGEDDPAGDEAPDEPVEATSADPEPEPAMRPSVGEPLVYEGTKLRIKTISETGEVFAKASYGKTSAAVRVDELTWDDEVGVWRVREA